jgi:hypothetical protein
MFCGIDNILQNIRHIQYECGEYYSDPYQLCGTDNTLRNIPHVQYECKEYFAEYC